MQRSRRTYALATTPRRQVDGVVDVAEIRLNVAGGTVRLERHTPREFVVRDEGGERRIAIAPERDKRLALALPVAAYMAARVMFATRRKMRRSRG